MSGLSTTIGGSEPSEVAWKRPLWGGADYYSDLNGEYVRSSGWRWQGPVCEDQHPYRGPQVHLNVSSGKSYGRGRWKLRANVYLSWLSINYFTPPEWEKSVRVTSLRMAHRLLDSLDMEAGLDALLEACYRGGEHTCTFRVEGSGDDATLFPLRSEMRFTQGYNDSSDNLRSGRYLQARPKGLPTTW